MAAERAPVPEWLDARLVERALAEADEVGDEAGASVAEMRVSHANAVGDHYASEMFRVTAVLVGGGERSVLVKCPPSGEQFQRLVETSGIFQVEGAMFASVVPQMRAQLEAAAPGRFPPFTARCLLHERAPRELIVLEDLKVHGFRLADRRRGLGLRHSLLALRALAHFHAASRALLETPEGLREISGFPNVFCSARDGFEKMIMNSFDMFATEIEKWESHEYYATKLRVLEKVVYDKLIAINNFDSSAFHVMLHGDFWVNNMLFRYEDERPEEVRFCDLQISHPGPPAVDLIYFLYSSVSEDVSERHSELLLRAYHAELSDTLQLLGCERRLRWSELRAQLEACGVYATFAAFVVLPIVKTEADRAFDTERALGDEGAAANAHMYSAQPYGRWARRLLPEMDARGWLDA